MAHSPRLLAALLAVSLGSAGSLLLGDEPANPAPPVAFPPDAAPPAVPAPPVAPVAPASPAATAPGVPSTVGGKIVTEEQHIARLTRDLQDRIELDPQLAGALVLGGQLVPREEGGRSLVLRGKFRGEDQIQILTDFLPGFLAADPYWSTVRDEVFVDLRGMPVIAPSGLFAARYYGIGIDFFWRGDYVAADRAFARAISEAPAVEAYRWWSVLTAIALGQSERAQAKLRPLLSVNPYGSQSPAIAAELTRVQGPLRWKLQALEKLVLLNDVLGAPAYEEVPAGPPPVAPPAVPQREARQPAEQLSESTHR